MPSTVTFLGDYNLDVVIKPDEYRVKGNTFWFRKNGHERVLTVTDLTQDRPRILPGSKSRIRENIDEIVEGLKIDTRDDGGGGQKTARIWGGFGNGSMDNGTYADITQRTERLDEKLNGVKIEGHFQGSREPRTHLILNVVDAEKPDRPRTYFLFRPQKFSLENELEPKFAAKLKESVQKRDALVLNSPKDLVFVSYALETASIDIPIYADVTKSFPRAFGINNVLPRASALFSIDDLLRYARTILGDSISTLSNRAMMDLVWAAMGSPKDDRFLIVTFGSEGAIGQDRRNRYHVGLSHGYRSEIQPHLKKALGAGDTFVSYAMHAHLDKGIKRVDEILQYATQGVLNHMGLAVNVPSSAYVIEKA